MVLDTSAVLAILLAEPEADDMVRALASDWRRLLGAPTLVEASAVMRAARNPRGPAVTDGPPQFTAGSLPLHCFNAR